MPSTSLNNYRRPDRRTRYRKEWTPAKRKSVVSYVASMQEVLRLLDWTIKLDWSNPCPADALAAITPMGSSRHATLALSPEFLLESPASRSQILLHELMHCHFFALAEASEAAMEAVAPKDTVKMFLAVNTGLVEMAVDTLADAFAPLVPVLSFK